MANRDVHAEIRSRIEAELGERTWSWLAQASGAPPSTLSNQVNRPRFTLDVPVRIAGALEKDLSHFLPALPLPGAD
jgi:hypothetical protein